MNLNNLPSFMDFFVKVGERLEEVGSPIIPDIDKVGEMKEKGMDVDQIVTWLVRNTETE